MMTKRHFEMVASIIADQVENGIGGVAYDSQMIMLHSLANQFATRFANDNPRFDAKRFFTACKLEKD